MANFLHKARYGLLPIKSVRHHFYWSRGPGDQPVARPPPPDVRTSEPRLRKWLARQAEYRSQECELCERRLKETAAHSLTEECSHGIDIATATGLDVQRLIGTHATKGKDHIAHLPLWFFAGDAANGLFPGHFAPFTELKSFDPFWGTLGYIPKALHKALDYFGVTDKKSLVSKIAQRVATGAFERWGLRCRANADGDARMRATIAARERVARGVG
jgi:hypothetical protein